jgi:exodeoxyribonuclease I
MDKTYLFYDIETTGLNKAFDQVLQFAAIRTDLQLQELARYEFFVKLNPDIVPSPKAIITHRIPLHKLTTDGISELIAIQKIHELFNTPNTISIGYNNLNFDDELLRFSFYRNLLPPYTHQYNAGCGRMDLYPIVLMYYLFNHPVLQWPEDNLKLENISRINNLAPGAAHNAMTDVNATIALAYKLFSDGKMWNYLCSYFDKQIDWQRYHQHCKSLDNHTLFLMIDGKFGTEHCYQAPVLPLGTHLHYKNQTLWLRLDQPELTELRSDNIQNAWVINKKMGETRLLLPMYDRFLKHLTIDRKQLITNNLDWLQKNKEIFQNISEYYCNFTYPKIPHIDVDAALYESSFLTTRELMLCQKFHQATPEHKLRLISEFQKANLQQLAIRLLGRHFPEYLTNEYQKIYQQYLQKIQSESNETTDYRGQKRLNLQQALAEINELKTTALDPEQQQLLEELQLYIIQKIQAKIT